MVSIDSNSNRSSKLISLATAGATVGLLVDAGIECHDNYSEQKRYLNTVLKKDTVNFQESGIKISKESKDFIAKNNKINYKGLLKSPSVLISLILAGVGIIGLTASVLHKQKQRKKEIN